MSETALFIKSLNVEKVRLHDLNNYHYYSMETPYTACFKDKVFPVDKAVKSEIVDIHEICRHENGATSRTLIAYNREVEELIAIPFSAIKNQNDTLKHQNSLQRLHLNRVRSLSFWKRFCFLFAPQKSLKSIGVVS